MIARMVACIADEGRGRKRENKIGKERKIKRRQASERTRDILMVKNLRSGVMLAYVCVIRRENARSPA